MPDSGTELWNKKAKPFQPLGFVPNILIYRVNKLGQSKLGAVSRHVSREICCHPFSFPCDPIRVRLRSLPAVRKRLARLGCYSFIRWSICCLSRGKSSLTVFHTTVRFTSK